MFAKTSSKMTAKFVLVGLLLITVLSNVDEVGYSQRSLFNCDPGFDILKGDDPRECLPGFSMSDTRSHNEPAVYIRDTEEIELLSSRNIVSTRTGFTVAIGGFAPDVYRPILLIEVLGTSVGIHFKGHRVNVYNLSGVHPRDVVNELGIEWGTAIVEKRFSPIRGSRMYFAWVDKNLDRDVDPGELSNFTWVHHSGSM